VSYTPGANPLRDLAGNQAAGFSNSPVINQTPNTNAPGAPVEDETVFWSMSGNPGVFEQATESGSQLFNVRYVRSNEVLLNLRTSATEVSYSVDGMTWLPFEPVQPTRVINLPEWEGLKTVYARLKDGATYLVRFVLDKTAPLVRASWLGGATVTDENGRATMLLDVSDNLCPNQDLEVFVNGQKRNYAREIPLTFSGSGAQSVSVQVKDKAGNIGSAVLDIIN
jgi:hypothetical protein